MSRPTQAPVPPDTRGSREIAGTLAANTPWRTMKKLPIALVALAIASFAVAAEPGLPLRSGRYAFQHRFAEQPEMPSIPLLARISGRHIVLINRTPSAVFPQGVIAEGTLMWHARSGQWIIGSDASDRDAEDVGGCSDGPEVVDLVQRIYWTC